ncbi:MAG: rod shape-determining protein MreC [Deltaproteobacteria bacterium]|nr:rod shape-determining protein MreC [Deltaproteobacteria bacterium]
MSISERTISSYLKKHQIVIASIFLALYSLHLALTYKQDIPRGYIVKGAVYYAAYPVQRLLIGTKSAVAGAWSHYVYLIGTAEENDELKKNISALRSENNRLREEINLSRRLKDLLEYRDAAKFDTTGANILSYNANDWSRTVLINKGKDDGIRKDLAVITPAGVVGRVIETGGKTGSVLLNTDSRSNIDVYVQRTRVKGVAEGNGNGGMALKYIRLDDDVMVGDMLLTSGISGIFPKGLPVGEIVRIEKGKDNFFIYIEARPAVDFKTLEDVLVVTESGFFYKE